MALHIVLPSIGDFDLSHRRLHSTAAEQERPDQHILNDGFAGNNVTFCYAAVTKAFACLGAKVFCPFGNRFVTTHTTHGCVSGDTEHNAEPISSTFGGGSGMPLKKLGNGRIAAGHCNEISCMLIGEFWRLPGRE